MLGSPIGAVVNVIVVSVLALARLVASLIWFGANPFAVVAATA